MRYHAAIVAIGLSLTVAGPVAAAPGNLDPTFGNGGEVLGPKDAEFLAVAVQLDGKLVAVGAANVISGPPDFLVERFLPDGSPDPTFGTAGIVETTVETTAGDSAFPSGLVVQPDGRIVVGGGAHRTGAPSNVVDSALVRYNSDGSLDATFGSGGIVVSPISGCSFVSITGMALQTDGKIVAAVQASCSDGSGSAGGALVRYDPDGTLDAAFGNGGVAPLVLPQTSPQPGVTLRGWYIPWAVLIQPNGEIVSSGEAGTSSAFGGTNHLAVTRSNPDGSLDAGFGAGGAAVTPSGNVSLAEGLVLQPDGKVVAGGVTDIGPDTGPADERMYLVRYNADGSLDPLFGTSGTVVTGPSQSNAAGLALQPDGKVVAAGWAATTADIGDVLLARYDGDGTADPTFFPNDTVITNIGPDAWGRAVVLQGDGKIVVVGAAFLNGDAQPGNAVMLRYEGGAANDLIPGGGSAKTDCLAEWKVVNPNNQPLYDRHGGASSHQTCADNDPTCDFDGGTNNSCTFRVSACVNMSDPVMPTCAATALAGFDVVTPSARSAQRSTAAGATRAAIAQATTAVLNAPDGSCSAPVDVVVPLKVTRYGKRLPGRQRIHVRAQGINGSTDSDTVVLTCTP